MFYGWDYAFQTIKNVRGHLNIFLFAAAVSVFPECPKHYVLDHGAPFFDILNK
jgi:hypothetical protein